MPWLHCCRNGAKLLSDDYVYLLVPGMRGTLTFLEGTLACVPRERPGIRIEKACQHRRKNARVARAQKQHPGV